MAALPLRGATALIRCGKSGIVPYQKIKLQKPTQNGGAVGGGFAAALHLKSFLKLRDTLPLMEEVREGGYIGIPLFQLEDGTLTLNLQDVLDRL